MGCSPSGDHEQALPYSLFSHLKRLENELSYLSRSVFCDSAYI